jgi:hypothetical protein
MVMNELRYEYHVDSQLKERSHKHSGLFLSTKYISSFRSLQPFILVIIGAYTIGVLAHAAQACKCFPLLPARDVIKQDIMVFRGKVLSVKTITLPEGYQYQRVEFLLKRLWKGENKRYITLATEMKNGECFYLLTKGKEYLVYTTHGPHDVTRCTRTKPWASVGREELEQLGKGQDIVGN